MGTAGWHIIAASMTCAQSHHSQTKFTEQTCNLSMTSQTVTSQDARLFQQPEMYPALSDNFL